MSPRRMMRIMRMVRMMRTQSMLQMIVALLGALAAAEAGAAELQPETLSAWDRYVGWTEHRMRQDAREGESFLLQDELSPELANEARRKLRAGEVFTTKLETTIEGRSIDVPGGLIHHWLGSVFIPNVRVDELVEWLQDYDEHYRYFDEVETSRLVAREGDEFQIFLRLRRKKVVTVYYNTEHFVRYTRHGEGRMSSASYSTRIAELDEAGTPTESEKPVGSDRGFLWRLNSYWRFEQAWGGVIVELESVSLSRGIPGALRWLVGSYLDSVPRESLEATLVPIQRESRRALTTENRQDHLLASDQNHP